MSTPRRSVFRSTTEQPTDTATGAARRAPELTATQDRASEPAGAGAKAGALIGVPHRASRSGSSAVMRSPVMLLSLQRLAGNRAVSGLLDEGPAPDVESEAPSTSTVGVGSQIGGAAPSDSGTDDDGETVGGAAPSGTEMLSIQRTPPNHGRDNASPPVPRTHTDLVRGCSQDTGAHLIEVALSHAADRLHATQHRASTRLSQWETNASAGADQVMRLYAQVWSNTWNDDLVMIPLRAHLERMLPGLTDAQVQQLVRLPGRSFGDTRGLAFRQQDVQGEELDRTAVAINGASAVLRSVSLGVPDHVIALLQPALRQLAARWYGRAEQLRAAIPAVQAGIERAATGLEATCHHGISQALDDLRRAASTTPPSADPVSAAHLIDQAVSRLASDIDGRVDRALATLDAQIARSSDYGNLQAECDQALRRFVGAWVARADELGPEISDELTRIRTSIEDQLAAAAVHDEMVAQAAQGSFWTGLGVNLVITIGVTALSGGTLTLPAMALIGMLAGAAGSVATQVTINVESNILSSAAHRDILAIDANEVLASGLVGGLAALSGGVASTATRMAERTALVRMAGSATIEGASNASATAAVDLLRGRPPGEDVAVAGIVGGISSVSHAAEESAPTEVSSTGPRDNLPLAVPGAREVGTGATTAGMIDAPSASRTTTETSRSPQPQPAESVGPRAGIGRGRHMAEGAVPSQSRVDARAHVPAFDAADIREMFLNGLGRVGPPDEAVLVHPTPEDFVAAYRQANGTGPAPLGFFVVDTRVLHLQPTGVIGTAVHEALHWRGAQHNLVGFIGTYWEEGLVDSLARQACGRMFALHPYDGNVAFVRVLSEALGPNVMNDALFVGDHPALQGALEQALGGRAQADEFLILMRSIDADGRSTLAGRPQALRDAMNMMWPGSTVRPP